ncbi:MAG TPA: dihydrofolate reductase family protein [Bdellovibrionota bacterium]|jgi:dihydrofolate reductase|nr:dihydrofolate reductase family protein [Bdellovibrionota bacterium]
MAKLIYVALMSLDGYMGDGVYDWSVPSESSTAFISEIMRPIGTYLYGRRMFETMAVWDTPELMPGIGESDLEFARVWQAADKIVYSKTLSAVNTKNTRLERDFDIESIRKLKARTTGDIAVAGPNLAMQAIGAGLVDEFQLFVVPATLGGGLTVLPKEHSHLELLEERRFGDGWVYLRYRPLKKP